MLAYICSRRIRQTTFSETYFSGVLMLKFISTCTRQLLWWRRCLITNPKAQVQSSAGEKMIVTFGVQCKWPIFTVWYIADFIGLPCFSRFRSLRAQVTCIYITWLPQPIKICFITTRPSSHVFEASIKNTKKNLFYKRTGSVGHEPFPLFHHGVLIWFECFSIMILCISKKASLRAEHFLYFNNSRIYGEYLVPVKCI